MRGHVLQEMLDRATDDVEFRHKAIEDLEGTFESAGYELTEDELAATREFHAQVKDMTDEQFEAQLGDVRPHG